MIPATAGARRPARPRLRLSLLTEGADTKDPEGQIERQESAPVDVTGIPAPTVRPVPPLAAADAAAGLVPRFRTVVETQPDATAVADGRAELSYAELAAAAARVLVGLRGALAALNPPPAVGGPEVLGGAEPVGMLYCHEVWAVAALLGVIASGHPVLVLDPR